MNNIFVPGYINTIKELRMFLLLSYTTDFHVISSAFNSINIINSLCLLSGYFDR